MAVIPSGSQGRPFSVIPQSLRDAAALQAEQHRRADAIGEESEEDALRDDLCEVREATGAICSGEPATVDRYGIPESATLDERLAYVQRMMEREAAARAGVRKSREKSPLHGVLQDFVDGIFEGYPDRKVKRLDVVVAADSADLPQDLMEIVELLPPGTYTRQRLCAQLNSSIGAHAWSHAYGMVR